MIESGHMDRALDEARAAAERGEVPVGAVVVDAATGEIVAAAGNQVEADNDPTAHAEMLALRQAARAQGSPRLTGCDLYVTLEPCAMCAGAIVLARVPRLVYGTPDPKAGACGSLFTLHDDPRLNHRAEVTAGVQADACGALLVDFFAERRAPGKTFRSA